VAELLDWPQATVVVKLEIAADGKSATAHREIEGAIEIVDLSLPAVIAAQKGLNEPRYASLKGIMAAKKKSIEPVDAASLGLSGDAKTVLEALIPPPPRAAGRKLEGDADQQVKELVRILHEEMKII
jgi:electron transfer flavoprotein beta subunit